MEKTKLFGLILAGGKSTRMGSDKGLLEYHGKPQRKYLFDLANKFCDQVFYSIREEQRQEFEGKSVIVDQNHYRGPFNGMQSAHEAFSDVAWLVLACDLPLLDAGTIAELIAQRDTAKMATSFATKKTKLPEPLVTIWEPHALQAAREHLKTAESSCPRKFLLNSEIKLVFPEKDEVLYNANSLEEFREAKSMIDS